MRCVALNEIFNKLLLLFNKSVLDMRWKIANEVCGAQLAINNLVSNECKWNNIVLLNSQPLIMLFFTHLFTVWQQAEETINGCSCWLHGWNFVI